MIAGREMLKEYRGLIGELKEAGHVKVGKNIHAVEKVTYTRKPFWAEEKKTSPALVDKHFSSLVKWLLRAQELRERLELHTSSSPTMPRTKRALESLHLVYRDLKGQAVKDAAAVLAGAREIQQAPVGVAKIDRTGVREMPINAVSTEEKERFGKVAEIASRHLRTLSDLPE